jgi:DNA repair protein RecN (Recombination protein N)
MLRLLRIRDFALIHNLEIEFGAGLNLLTGETGSGKSILVDALGLLLGGRSSAEMVRSNCDLAVVEGIFKPASPGVITQLLEESGIDPEEETLLIRREISTGSRNRIFINNSAATLALLKTVGENLADIHGQQDQKSLLDLTTHLDWLDRFGKNESLLADVQGHFKRMRDIALRLDSMAMDEQDRLRRMDILQFQLNEIQRANLRPQEREELEKEKNILANREKIHALATEAYTSLYDSEASLLGQSRRLDRILQELERYDVTWASHRDFLHDSLYRLEDLAYLMRDYGTKIDFTPQRLDEVERRLSELERLSKKYGPSESEIMAYGARCEKQLNELVSHADTSRQLLAELAEVERVYRTVADALSEKRRHDAVRLEREICKEFAALSMDNAFLRVNFAVNDECGDVTNRIPASYGPDGIDHVEFMLAPNKGEDLRPLAKIASGGELSRVMLAIKSICGAGKGGRTLVFDEVDAGIGGRVAEAVGRRLREIACDNQVLCVTHLPQIAAFARHHFSVRKELMGSRTETRVEALGENERVQELARMLGGEVITATTRRHAQEMLAYSSRAAQGA